MCNTSIEAAKPYVLSGILSTGTKPLALCQSMDHAHTVEAMTTDTFLKKVCLELKSNFVQKWGISPLRCGEHKSKMWLKLQASIRSLLEAFRMFCKITESLNSFSWFFTVTLSDFLCFMYIQRGLVKGQKRHDRTLLLASCIEYEDA